jgi:hypothetical protein
MRVVGLVCLLVIGVGIAALTVALPRTAFTMYDEGVYYYQAVLLSHGHVPYRDYFAPQPPGVLVIGAASERIGAGIAGVRAVSWLCGVALLVQTHQLARRLAKEQHVWCAVIASGLVAVTVVFAYQSIQGATNMPSACLELAACLLVLSEGRNRFALAGLVLAIATLLRLQSVIAAPGLLLLVFFAEGRAGFWSRSVWFVGTLVVGCAAIHLSLAVTLPGYLSNVVEFQLDRVRTDWTDRSAQILEFLSEPVTLLGLPAAVWFAMRGEGRLRGLTIHALVTTCVVTVAGKSLSVMYYLSVLPLFAACAAVVITRLAESLWRFVSLVPLVAIAIRAPTVVGTILTQLAPNAEHAACVAAVRDAPGQVVFVTDGRIAVLAGKQLPTDYYATDPNALYLLGPERFHAWFAAILPAVDLVVVTPQLLGWMSTANAEQLVASGKPVFFDTPTTQAVFDSANRPRFR